MTRWKLTLEYDGAGFVGWQRQDNGPSVKATWQRGNRATFPARGRWRN